MACDLWQGKLDTYLDGELPEKETSELDVHLRACPSCAADALQRVRLKRLVQSAGKRFTPRPEFQRKIRQQIASSVRPARSWLWLPELGLAAAMVLVFLIAGILGVQRFRRDQAFSEVADLHVATLASSSPVDVVSSDRHTVKPWFQGKLAFTFNLPELQNSPFTLLGGRLAYLDQQPGAQLIFEYRKHRISVFVFQDRGRLAHLTSGDAPVRRVSFNVETWSTGGLRYVIVGDADAEQIHALSQLMKTSARSE